MKEVREKSDLEIAHENVITLIRDKNKLEDALQKTVGILTNIRHETDYMPDSYYEWIDRVVGEVEDLLSEDDEDEDEQLGNQSTEDGFEFLFGKRD